MKTKDPFLGNERTLSGRMNEIDYLKCVCILLMVIFHLTYIGDKYPYAKQVVYTFHMPIFLLISGYLTNIGKSIKEFLKKYLWIFIPYAVMETSYAVASCLLPVRQGPAGRNRSDLRLTRRPLLVSTYAYTLRLALLRCLPSCARRSNYSLYHSRTLPLWLGIPAPTSLRKCYLLSRRMYIGTDPRKTKPFLPPIYMGCCTTHFIMCRTRKSISREFGRSNHYLPGIMSVTLLLPTSDESLSSRLPVHRTTYASHSTFFPCFYHAG